LRLRASTLAAASRATAALAMGWMLTACGFHLQGRLPLPHALEHVRIETDDTQSGFYQGLRDALRTAGAQLDDDKDDASATVIHILRDDVKQDVLAVSIYNIPTAFELTYTVRVSVTNGPRELIASEEHALRRDYAFDESTLLAKEREKDVLIDALAQDLAAVVMRRLASL
jgi:outer membrane lipopolysaccharide assembly protein LptE/RlpB